MRPEEEWQVLAESDTPVIAADEDGRIAFASAAAARELGRPLSAGAPLTSLMPERLRARHREGFRRYTQRGESRLEGRPVRVPALGPNGTEVEIDLTIRIFQRPDGSRLAVAAIQRAGTGRPPADLMHIESAFAKRAYDLL